MNQNLCDMLGEYVKVTDGVVTITDETGEASDPFDGAEVLQPGEDEVHEEGAGIYIKVGATIFTTEHWDTTETAEVFTIIGVKRD